VKPDIILLDIMMPEMDGFQTIREIKSFEKYNSIKIFAVTARAMEKGKDVLKNSGFDDFIFKPINSIELINKIYTHLNVHKIEEYEKNTDNR
jgi:DNA-binding response OmpR family regulator